MLEVQLLSKSELLNISELGEILILPTVQKNIFLASFRGRETSFFKQVGPLLFWGGMAEPADRSPYFEFADENWSQVSW